MLIKKLIFIKSYTYYSPFPGRTRIIGSHLESVYSNPDTLKAPLPTINFLKPLFPA